VTDAVSLPGVTDAVSFPGVTGSLFVGTQSWQFLKGLSGTVGIECKERVFPTY
jgi:hypothetical protein